VVFLAVMGSAYLRCALRALARFRSAFGGTITDVMDSYSGSRPDWVVPMVATVLVLGLASAVLCVLAML
jgi:hypothetical protein